MSRLARVLVVLPVLNAQDRISRQIESILAQEGVDVTLQISDNASTDSTFRLAEEYADECPRIRLTYNPQDEGAERNLMGLLYHAPIDEYDFLAIAHQGDTWHPDKLQAAVAHLTANTSRPELYYSDIDIVEAPGIVKRSALGSFATCASHPSSLLVVPNWAWPCSMVMNGALVKLLRRYGGFDFGRTCGAWIHAIALYCGGFVFPDLTRSFVSHCPTDDEREALVLLSEWPPTGDERISRAFTEMAEGLVREYGDILDRSIAKTAEAVVMRHSSPKARSHLFKSADIAMPSGIASSRLRMSLLLNRF